MLITIIKTIFIAVLQYSLNLAHETKLCGERFTQVGILMIALMNTIIVLVGEEPDYKIANHYLETKLMH